MKNKLLVILLLFYAVTCINSKEVSAAKEKFIIEDGKVGRFIITRVKNSSYE